MSEDKFLRNIIATVEVLFNFRGVDVAKKFAEFQEKNLINKEHGKILRSRFNELSEECEKRRELLKALKEIQKRKQLKGGEFDGL